MKIRVLSYNIHRAIGFDRRFAPERIVEILQGHNADIVLLSSIGGLFEGINVISGYFSTNYDAKKVGILNQADLVDYFIKQLDKNAKLLKDADVKKVYEGLKAVQKIYKADAKLSQKSVKSINAETKKIIDLITKS